MRAKLIHRIIFLSATCFVLALLVISAIFWFRSHTRGDHLRYHRDPRHFEILSCDGLFMVGWGTLQSKSYPVREGLEATFWPFASKEDSISMVGHKRGLLGFKFERWKRDTADLKANIVNIEIPYWFIALVWLVTAATGLRSQMRALVAWRRVRAGLCPGCGYDLRATPERCPECGLVATKS